MGLPGKKMMAGAAVALAATGTLAPSAFADTGTGPSTSTPAPASGNGASTTGDILAAIKARAAAAISARESALQAAVTAVDDNKYLTSDDRTRILATLDSDISGLEALAPVIQADTTVAKATADLRTIFTGYRVFALALPQARFAAAADDLTGTVLPRLTDARARLQALLEGADSGKNTPAVQAAMTDLGTQISSIASETNGLSGTVLAFTPADWNANHALLVQPRAQLVSARADARTARVDIRTVVKALR